MKVNINANAALDLSFVDGEFIREQVNAGKMKLKHESNELFGSFLITASTSELQAFLEKYGNDERVFSKKTSVHLTRKPAHS